MPLDGIVTKNIVYELNKRAAGGRIDKIYQPAREEIVMVIRAAGKTLKLLITSNADYPRMHITESRPENPQSPPMFCMTLRKHLSGGKIIEFFQPELERIIEIRVESFNEMGDMSEKRLILEIMGKHSNIILINENEKIVDCAKKISFEKSSVREVLPGKQYEYPPGQGKRNPLCLDERQFYELLDSNKALKISDAVYKSYCGISPLMSVEICARAGICESDYIEALDNRQRGAVYSSFVRIMDLCGKNEYSPEIVYSGGSIVDFSSVSLAQFDSLTKVKYDEISVLLGEFYDEKAKQNRLKQKTLDLRKLIDINIRRCVKKRDVLDKAMKDTDTMDEWRTNGELITAYISLIPQGAGYYDAEDFYNGNRIKRIKLDVSLTPAQNATRYFEKYNKAKRQKKAVIEQIAQNEEELSYLEGLYNIVYSPVSQINESDIAEIRAELHSEGYLKKNPVKKGIAKSEPLHYVSTDGFHIYVGKNNKQNDELTLKFASPNDIWLHTKEIPGSHVIIRTEGSEPGEAVLNEAAMLAAFNSKAKHGSMVPVDYARRKHVKKPNGARPGMVIYDNYKTAYVTPDIAVIDSLRQV